MQEQELGGAVKGQRDMEEIRYGGEGPHWAAVPMKKKLYVLVIFNQDYNIGSVFSAFFFIGGSTSDPSLSFAPSIDEFYDPCEYF